MRERAEQSRARQSGRLSQSLKMGMRPSWARKGNITTEQTTRRSSSQSVTSRGFQPARLDAPRPRAGWRRMANQKPASVPTTNPTIPSTKNPTVVAALICSAPLSSLPLRSPRRNRSKPTISNPIHGLHYVPWSHTQ